MQVLGKQSRDENVLISAKLTTKKKGASKSQPNGKSKLVRRRPFARLSDRVKILEQLVKVCLISKLYVWICCCGPASP
jgi:hypothetical protein